MKFYLMIFALIVFINPIKVKADIALLIHENTGFAQQITGVGHVTVYLSNLCTDPPLVLRKCHRNELPGTVLSTYPGIGVNADFKWFAIPAHAYLYGVDKEQEIILYANSKIRDLLSETNRAQYLSKQIPRQSAESIPEGRWDKLFAAVLDRDIYAFTVITTLEQDLKFLSKYNLSPTGNDFNIFTNNCADFTKEIMNFYFPNSVSRDLINDFGIVTPKTIARTFTNYASARPNLKFYIKKYSQLDGSIIRSWDVRNLTEMAYRSKKYVAVQLLTMPMLIPIFTGINLMSGSYFNLNSAYLKYPSPEMAVINWENHSPRNKADFRKLTDLQKTERIRLFGEKALWKNYRQKLSVLLEKALARRLFLDKREIATFYRDLELQSEPFYDENEDLYLKVNEFGQEKFLGLTRRNILKKGFDTNLAYKLMLVKVKYELEAPEKNRETLEVFQQNWQLLTKLSELSKALPNVQNSGNLRFLTVKEKKSFGRKILKFIGNVTR